jgi:hypothetical protein
MMRQVTSFAFILTVLSGLAFGGDACQPPYSRWNKEYVAKMLSDSGWSKRHVMGRVHSQAEGLSRSRGGQDPGLGRNTNVTGNDTDRGMDRGPGITGEKELLDSYTVRLFSALPIRQAFIRQFQIATDYEHLPAEDKTRLDGQFEQALKMDVSEKIMITVSFASNNRELEREVTRQLVQATGDSLHQKATLITDGHGRIALTGYLPPGRDGAGAKLIFPRMIEGKPTVAPTDKEIKLEFFVPGTSHKVFVTWKVKDLRCNGELLL